jgi:hypothetical protein
MRYVMIAAVAIVVASVGFAGISEAQPPPRRFYGALTIDGQPAPAGTRVIAEILDMDCSSYPPAVNTLPAGQYVVDARGGGPGCGMEGATVFFKVGTRYASQTGIYESGDFFMLDLTISGAATKPVVPGATPTATPTAAVTATPTPTPTPTPAPTPPPPPPFSLSILDLNSPCIPAAGQVVCDTERTRLWNGDMAAWAMRYAAQGLPPPTPDQVFEQTFGFRIEAGDPAAIGAVAEALGWPHVRINATRFRGRTSTELDEWVEVKNLGGAPQDMSQWSVRVEGTGRRWTFADGFMLQPGQACKFYTGAPMADPCLGSSNIASTGVLPNDAGTLTLWVDFLDLKAIEVRYAADPTRQPPPPNLQGFN